MTQVYVNQDSPRSAEEGSWINLKGTKRGEICIIDFYIQQALEENAYQMRAGTVTTPLTGDVNITDADAGMAVVALVGMTIIPCELWISLDAQLADPIEIAVKSVGTSTMSGGTSFVPLNLFIGGKAPVVLAMYKAAGDMTVEAELATTTRQHFSISAEFAKDDGTEWGGTVQCGKNGGYNPIIWTPRVPPVLVGDACFYVQVAGGTTGPTYFAHFDFIELPTASVV